MTTDKRQKKKKAIYDSAILAAGWTPCILTTCQDEQGTVTCPTICSRHPETNKLSLCVCVCSSRPWPISYISVKKDWHLLWKVGAKISRNSINWLFRKFTVPSSVCFFFFFLSFAPPNAAFFQMNEKLCKRPGALTSPPPPVTSCQLINQMRLLLCLHSARPYWLVLVDLTITPRHMKMASDPSLIFNLRLHHFSSGISGTTAFISYCAPLCLIIIHTEYIRGAATLELSRIIAFTMCLLPVAFEISSWSTFAISNLQN